MKLGDIVSDFQVDTTNGLTSFHALIGDKYFLLCSHPADYTPVCTTELAELSKLEPEFRKRGVKVGAISCDSVERHRGWSADIQQVAGFGNSPLPYVILADPTRELATKLCMLDPVEKDKTGMPVTARAVFLFGPDKRLKFSILYPATSGRNYSEILRITDSILITAKYPKIATPVNWKLGDRVMVQPFVPEADLGNKVTFPAGVEILSVPSQKRYLRYTDQPAYTP